MQSLEEVSGSDWDEPTAQAWECAISLVVSEMQEGAALAGLITQDNSPYDTDLDCMSSAKVRQKDN